MERSYASRSGRAGLDAVIPVFYVHHTPITRSFTGCFAPGPPHSKRRTSAAMRLHADCHPGEQVSAVWRSWSIARWASRCVVRGSVSPMFRELAMETWSRGHRCHEQLLPRRSPMAISRVAAAWFFRADLVTRAATMVEGTQDHRASLPGRVLRRTGTATDSDQLRANRRGDGLASNVEASAPTARMRLNA
jgi:hypothetical protein